MAVQFILELLTIYFFFSQWIYFFFSQWIILSLYPFWWCCMSFFCLVQWLFCCINIQSIFQRAIRIHSFQISPLQIYTLSATSLVLHKGSVHMLEGPVFVTIPILSPPLCSSATLMKHIISGESGLRGILVLRNKKLNTTYKCVMSTEPITRKNKLFYPVLS